MHVRKLEKASALELYEKIGVVVPKDGPFPAVTPELLVTWVILRVGIGGPATTPAGAEEEIADVLVKDAAELLERAGVLGAKDGASPSFSPGDAIAKADELRAMLVKKAGET